MSKELDQLKEDYHNAYEEMMDFRKEMKKKFDDRRVLKLSHYLNADRSPEDKARFEEARAKQKEIDEKYKKYESQNDAREYARLEARANAILEEYEKLKEYEERESSSNKTDDKKIIQTPEKTEGESEEPARKTWIKPMVAICVMVMIVGAIALIANNIQETNKRKDPLDLLGYPLSYACGLYATNIKHGSHIVSAKTLADLKAGKGNETIAGVKTTDYPIDCANYRTNDHNVVWDYYIISYNQGDAGMYVYTNLIITTREEAIKEGIRIRDGF